MATPPDIPPTDAEILAWVSAHARTVREGRVDAETFIAKSRVRIQRLAQRVDGRGRRGALEGDWRWWLGGYAINRQWPRNCGCGVVTMKDRTPRAVDPLLVYARHSVVCDAHDGSEAGWEASWIENKRLDGVVQIATEAGLIATEDELTWSFEPPIDGVTARVLRVAIPAVGQIQAQADLMFGRGTVIIEERPP